MREGFTQYTPASPRVCCFLLLLRPYLSRPPPWLLLFLFYNVSDRSVYTLAGSSLALRLQIIVGDENKKIIKCTELSRVRCEVMFWSGCMFQRRDQSGCVVYLY